MEHLPQGEWLQRRAAKLHLSQADIVRLMGEEDAHVSRSMVSNWFNDHSPISERHIAGLAIVLRTSTHQLRALRHFHLPDNQQELTEQIRELIRSAQVALRKLEGKD